MTTARIPRSDSPVLGSKSVTTKMDTQRTPSKVPALQEWGRDSPKAFSIQLQNDCTCALPIVEHAASCWIWSWWRKHWALEQAQELRPCGVVLLSGMRAAHADPIVGLSNPRVPPSQVGKEQPPAYLWPTRKRYRGGRRRGVC
jgi:hypothetical protein